MSESKGMALDMNKKIYLILFGLFIVFNTYFGNISAKASGVTALNSISDDNGANVVDTISVEQKNILASNNQLVTVTIKNNNGIGFTGSSYTGVKDMTVDYKLPSGSYTQVQLSRNGDLSSSSFTGYLPTN